MRIRIKGIYHERTEDAPFIGALVCANKCFFNCKNCFNQDIKDSEGLYVEDYKIIRLVLSNHFNEGVILAGLEWTLQPEEMFRLIELTIKNGLQVILYTGLDKDDLLEKHPQLLKYDMYIKCGRYIESLRTTDNKQFGVNLASSNQNIYKIIKGVPYEYKNKLYTR